MLHCIQCRAHLQGAFQVVLLLPEVLRRGLEVQVSRQRGSSPAAALARSARCSCRTCSASSAIATAATTSTTGLRYAAAALRRSAVVCSGRHRLAPRGGAGAVLSCGRLDVAGLLLHGLWVLLGNSTDACGSLQPVRLRLVLLVARLRRVGPWPLGVRFLFRGVSGVAA